MKDKYDYFIQWHLTDRCNLACLHCYQRGIGHTELPASRVLELLGDFKSTLDAWSIEYNLSISPSMQFTGGEPLMRADLFEILQAARSGGFETFLLTNGTLVDKTTARKIKKADVSAVQVSLDGLPETHDTIRGQGSYAKAASGIAALTAAGVEVTLNVTLTSMNVSDIEEMTELASDLGAARIGFSRLVPEGRGQALAGKMLTPIQVESAYRLIKTISKPGIQALTRDPLNCLTNGQAASGSCGKTAIAGCAAGLSGITILPDGSVMPCRRMNIVIGNINDTSLRELWATSPVLEDLRDKESYTGRCGECDKWDICRGCRAVAYAASVADGAPDYLADDPQCFLKK